MTKVRLRKLLGTHQAVAVADECVSLDPAVCWIDVQAFEATLRDADKLRAGERAELGVPRLEEAPALYRGTFLPGGTGEAWLVQMRLRLRGLFVAAVEDLGAWYELQGQWDRSVACYRRGIEADDLVEAFYLGQMRCHLASARTAEGLAVYRRLRQTLSVVLGVAASRAAEKLARALADAGRQQAGDPSFASVGQR